MLKGHNLKTFRPQRSLPVNPLFRHHQSGYVACPQVNHTKILFLAELFKNPEKDEESDSEDDTDSVPELENEWFFLRI